MELLTPTELNLHLYLDALERELAEGLEPFHNSLAIIDKARQDPRAFIATLNDPLGGRLISLPGGIERPALPSFTRWLFHDEICGTIQFRWQPGGAELPPWCLGHIGYQIFPWQRGKGLATKQLALMLDFTRSFALPYVELTTDPENSASQRVIAKNGGIYVRRIEREEQYGGGSFNLYRIA